MSRPLVQRIRTLLSADAHGLVESLEERSLMLKQYVREAELELDRKRARLEALSEAERSLAEELEQRQEQTRALDEDIALALAGGKEELARFAIRRLIPRRREIASLEAQLAERGRERAALQERLEVQQEQFEGLKKTNSLYAQLSFVLAGS